MGKYADVEAIREELRKTPFDSQEREWALMVADLAIRNVTTVDIDDRGIVMKISNEKLIRTARACATAKGEEENAMVCSDCEFDGSIFCRDHLLLALADALEAVPVQDKTHAMAVAAALHDYFVREG